MKTCLTVFTDHLKRLNNLSAAFQDHFAPRWNDLAASGNHLAAQKNHFTAHGNDFAPHGNDFALCRNHFFAGRRSSGVLHKGLCLVQDSENKVPFKINLNHTVA